MNRFVILKLVVDVMEQQLNKMSQEELYNYLFEICKQDCFTIYEISQGRHVEITIDVFKGIWEPWHGYANLEEAQEKYLNVKIKTELGNIVSFIEYEGEYVSVVIDNRKFKQNGGISYLKEIEL